MHTLLLLLLTGASITAAEPPINPVPRESLPTTVHTWTFDSGDEGWTAENLCLLSTDEGRLHVRSTGLDPYFHCPVDLPGGTVALQIRMRTRDGGPGSVFWTTRQDSLRAEDKRVDFEITADGQWHETSASFNAPGQLTDLRIDPGVQPGECEIEWIRLIYEELHPLEITHVGRTKDEALFHVKNHTVEPITFSANGSSRTVTGSQTLALAVSIVGANPLESVSMELALDGWPPVVRTLVVDNFHVKVDWIDRSVDGFLLRVAPDGSAAHVSKAGQMIAVLGPLVQRNGKLPTLQRIRTDGDTLRFQGEGVELSLVTSGGQVSVSIKSDTECEGPVVRVFGGLQQGLFAGLEYLGRGELSSSKLDIESPEHIRYAPDPMKVTMPLMAMVTDRASVAVSWDDMTLQPVYATPNFFDGSPDHRMSLRGSTINAVIRFASDPLEESILWAVQRDGLPPLPEAPRTPHEQRELGLAALNGPLRTDEGWGHCVEERWKRQPFSDMASTVYRLGGELPDLPRLALEGAHLPNGSIYFLTGRAQEWLDTQEGRAGGLIARQQADGSFRYDGEYARGHFENTASGVCGWPAARLLELAYFTGNEQTLAAGLRALEFAKRFNTPRGAQVWECPMHTPDQLASGYLVWAYVRGYELTGDKEYLAHARKWALSGVPFTYLWECQPIMLYATPPVYGATQWKAPNWMGLPVQWVGGVYAYALTKLAPYDDTLDWNHLARGILLSGEHQQYPDGPNVGLLPDSFNLQHQRRQPADINPCALASLRMALDGQVDFLAVAVDGSTRVAAPFPVVIREGEIHVDAPEGVEYQMLVNGEVVERQ